MVEKLLILKINKQNLHVRPSGARARCMLLPFLLNQILSLSSALGRSFDRLSEAAHDGDIPCGSCGHFSSWALLRRQRPLGQGGDADGKID